MKIASCALAGRTGHEAGRALLAALYREETGHEFAVHCRKSRVASPISPAATGIFPSPTPHEHAFCALSRRDIGIDAEERDRNVNLALAKKILSPKEKAQFDAAPDKRRALLTFWVLKEARVKRTGEGLRGYPNETDFSLDDPRVTEMDGCLVAVIE